MPPSADKTMSQASACRRSRTSAVRLGLPISSSASNRNRKLTGGPPPAAKHASAARIGTSIEALSSLTPRPYQRPLRSVSANGGDAHNASGSGGCTSQWP
jgi:hypothetical protein